MTDIRIKELIRAIEKVTRAIDTKEKAIAFLRSAGIASTPPIRSNSSKSQDSHKK